MVSRGGVATAMYLPIWYLGVYLGTWLYVRRAIPVSKVPATQAHGIGPLTRPFGLVPDGRETRGITSDIHSCIHGSCMHGCIHGRMHGYLHAWMHAGMHAWVYVCMDACDDACMGACVNAWTDA